MRKWLFTGHDFRGARSAGKGAVLACSLAATLFAAAAQGADRPPVNEVEVTPFIGYMVGGEFEDPADASGRDIKEDTNFGVVLNLMADGPERHYELLYSQQSTQVEGAVPLDLDVQYLQLGGIVSFTDNPRIIPFFGITVGAARFRPDADGMDSETKVAFSIGGGLKIPITDHIGIRLDTRAFITLLDSDSQIFCVSNPDVASGCRIRAKSDTLLQYGAFLGVTAGF